MRSGAEERIGVIDEWDVLLRDCRSALGLMPNPSTEARARAQTHQDVRGEWLSSTLLQLVLPVTDH